MSAQLTDVLYAERTGIPGKITISDIANVIEEFDKTSFVYEIDSSYIYRAWARNNTNTYLSLRFNLATGQAAGSFDGPTPISADIKTLIYT